MFLSALSALVVKGKKTKDILVLLSDLSVLVVKKGEKLKSLELNLEKEKKNNVDKTDTQFNHFKTQ